MFSVFRPACIEKWGSSVVSTDKLALRRWADFI